MVSMEHQMEKDEKWTVEADKDCVEVGLPGQADQFVDSLLALADAADDAGLAGSRRGGAG